jgi:beta-glucosidase
MNKVVRRRWLSAACASAAILGSAIGTVPETLADDVHPEQWPQARSRGLVDAATEARIGELLAKMSLEQKVGQIIQTDISAVVPEDLARYPLGSILAGGNGGPNGNDRATPGEWLELSRRFHAAALAPRPGHVPIPLIFGIDAVHGHGNMLGAVIFPHRRCHRRGGGGHRHRLDVRADARGTAGRALGAEL